MVASIDNIIESLNRDTHLRVQNEVGQELAATLRNYESEIRTNSFIGNPQTFTADIKGALKRALSKHLALTPATGSIQALIQSITDDILRQYFNFSETDVERSLSNSRIDNYDDFAYNFIQTSRDATVTQLVRYGQQGVQGHVQDSALRPAFFDTTKKYFPGSFSWTDYAKKESMDIGSITQILSAAASGTINPRMATEKPKLLTYTP